MAKYVKDDAHNKYPAYCCEDIDTRLARLEEAVAALVAGSVPDGSVTLPKLANDARTWTREINKGLLTAEWIGTKAEYEAHIAENGGEPNANTVYTITDVDFLPDTKSNNDSVLTLNGKGYYILEIRNEYAANRIYDHTTGMFYWDGENDLYLPPIVFVDGTKMYMFPVKIKFNGQVQSGAGVTLDPEQQFYEYVNVKVSAFIKI